MIWGVDLAKKSIHMVGLGNGDELKTFKTKQLDRHDQLSSIARFFEAQVNERDFVFIEEPPYVNNRQVFLALAQTSGALLAVSPAETYMVPVDTWKQSVVGKGGVSKQVVATWLAEHHEKLFKRCEGDQNFVDAACIALFGAGVVTGEDS